MTVDAIFFEKDGTLIDFDEFWILISIKAIEIILKRTNMCNVPANLILEAFGVSDGITSIGGVLCKGTYRQMGEIVYNFLPRYGYNGSRNEVITFLIDAYNENADAGQIMPTCPELATTLYELKKQNKRLAIVTTDSF